jgi:hypothetical protein
MDESIAQGHDAEAEDMTIGIEREIVEHNGLRSLFSSFICSGVLAVSTILPQTKITQMPPLACRLLFPGDICYSYLG